MERYLIFHLTLSSRRVVSEWWRWQCCLLVSYVHIWDRVRTCVRAHRGAQDQHLCACVSGYGVRIVVCDWTHNAHGQCFRSVWLTLTARPFQHYFMLISLWHGSWSYHALCLIINDVWCKIQCVFEYQQQLLVPNLVFTYMDPIVYWLDVTRPLLVAWIY